MKKIVKLNISIIIAFLMGIVQIYAENISPVLDCDSGKEVTVNKINCSDGAFSLRFDVKNTGSKGNKNLISVDVLNADGKRLAGYSAGKTIDIGKSVPVNFSAVINNAEDVNEVRISVKNYDTKTICVSPYGSDMGYGTKSSPIKSLSKAVSMIKGYDLRGEYDNIEVLFEKGEYDVLSTQTLAHLKNIKSVRLRGEGENTVFSGGIVINASDMTRISNEEAAMFPASSANSIYRVDLSDYGYTADFKYNSSLGNPLYTALYNNGEEQSMARYPEDGYNTATTAWSEASATGLSFTSDTALPEWDYIENAWVGGFFVYDWSLGYGQIGDINGNQISVKYCNGGIPEGVLDVSKTNKKWFAFNLPEELDKPGEYVIYNNVLYYYPDGDIADMTLKLNTSENDMISVYDCANITIEGITFENSRGYFVNVGNNTNNINILGCSFKNNSENAVVVNGTNNYNNTVKSCDFNNIGANPIIIGGGDRASLTSSGHVLENCYFDNFNSIVRTNCGAVALKGCGVTMKNNTITGAPHLAISYNGNDHVIEYNDIYNCLTDNADDAGIIYTGRNLSTLGNVISNNYIHDSNSGHGAIYFDDFLSGQSVSHNVFENVDAALFIHGGVCTSFTDNYVYCDTDKDYAVGLFGENPGNQWDTAYANDAGNTLLRELVTLPWEGELWQSRFSNVLKYVNNKNKWNCSETYVNGNYFINLTDPAKVIAHGNKNTDITGTNYSSISAQKLSEYQNVKSACGIYSDSYRTVQ